MERSVRSRFAANVRGAGSCVEKVQDVEVESIKGLRSHASSSRGISSRTARQDAVGQGHRFRVPECQAQGQEAAVRVHHGAEVSQTFSGHGVIKKGEKVRLGNTV